MNAIGVDGCKDGWIAISLNNDGWEINLFSDVSKLWQLHKCASIILIDIPIGLRECDCLERLCDLEARKLLGPPRASSVFPAPCRSALLCNSYAESCSTNRTLVGRGMSLQTWSISRKIREIDEFLLEHESARGIIIESHPEITFYAFNGCQPMQFNKKNHWGFSERYDLLKSIYPKTEEIVNCALKKFFRKQVAKDDILDALCLAITGLIGLKYGFKTLPNVPEKDAKGHKMQIVFCSNQVRPARDNV